MDAFLAPNIGCRVFACTTPPGARGRAGAASCSLVSELPGARITRPMLPSRAQVVERASSTSSRLKGSSALDNQMSHSEPLYFFNTNFLVTCNTIQNCRPSTCCSLPAHDLGGLGYEMTRPLFQVDWAACAYAAPCIMFVLALSNLHIANSL